MWTWAWLHTTEYHDLLPPLPLGPFSDGIRQMDDPDKPKIVQPSAGIHIILPGYYSPRSMGLLDPSTSDGRVIFFLPWEGWYDVGFTQVWDIVQLQ